MEWFEDVYNRQIYFDLYMTGDVKIAFEQVSGIERMLSLQPKQNHIGRLLRIRSS